MAFTISNPQGKSYLYPALPRYEIYNMSTGEALGTYTAETPDQALDVMARDYGFADYVACIAGYGVDIETAKAELQITVV